MTQETREQVLQDSISAWAKAVSSTKMEYVHDGCEVLIQVQSDEVCDHIYSILKEATDRVKDQYTTVGELEKSIPSKPHVFLEIFESARIKSSQHGHELSDQSHLNVELNRLLNMNDPSSRKHINISPEDVFPLDRLDKNSFIDELQVGNMVLLSIDNSRYMVAAKLEAVRQSTYSPEVDVSVTFPIYDKKFHTGINPPQPMSYLSIDLSLNFQLEHCFYPYPFGFSHPLPSDFDWNYYLPSQHSTNMAHYVGCTGGSLFQDFMAVRATLTQAMQICQRKLYLLCSQVKLELKSYLLHDFESHDVFSLANDDAVVENTDFTAPLRIFREIGCVLFRLLEFSVICVEVICSSPLESPLYHIIEQYLKISSFLPAPYLVTSRLWCVTTGSYFHTQDIIQYFCQVISRFRGVLSLDSYTVNLQSTSSSFSLPGEGADELLPWNEVTFITRHVYEDYCDQMVQAFQSHIKMFCMADVERQAWNHSSIYRRGNCVTGGVTTAILCYRGFIFDLLSLMDYEHDYLPDFQFQEHSQPSACLHLVLLLTSAFLEVLLDTYGNLECSRVRWTQWQVDVLAIISSVFYSLFHVEQRLAIPNVLSTEEGKHACSLVLQFMAMIYIRSTVEANLVLNSCHWAFRLYHNFRENPRASTSSLTSSSISLTLLSHIMHYFDYLRPQVNSPRLVHSPDFSSVQEFKLFGGFIPVGAMIDESTVFSVNRLREFRSFLTEHRLGLTCPIESVVNQPRTARTTTSANEVRVSAVASVGMIELPPMTRSLSASGCNGLPDALSLEAFFIESLGIDCRQSFSSHQASPFLAKNQTFNEDSGSGNNGVDIKSDETDRHEVDKTISMAPLTTSESEKFLLYPKPISLPPDISDIHSLRESFSRTKLGNLNVPQADLYLLELVGIFYFLLSLDSSNLNSVHLWVSSQLQRRYEVITLKNYEAPESCVGVVDDYPRLSPVEEEYKSMILQFLEDPLEHLLARDIFTDSSSLTRLDEKESSKDDKSINRIDSTH